MPAPSSAPISSSSSKRRCGPGSSASTSPTSSSSVARVEPDLRRQRDLLYRRADEQRMQGDAPAALLTLEELERLHPRFSRLFQERGLCHVQLKQAPEAIEALVRAVNLNPALPVSWSMLARLFRMTRQEAQQL